MIGVPLPIGAPAGEPPFRSREGLRIDAAGANTPCLFRSHEPAGLEHLEVLQHGGERHVERPGEVAHCHWSSAQPLDHDAPSRVGERLKDEVERAGMVKHRLNHTARRLATSSDERREWHEHASHSLRMRPENDATSKELSTHPTAIWNHM